MTAFRPTPRRRASLKLPLSVPALISAARAIAHSMTDNPSFPDPAPTLQTVLAAIDDLADAEATTRSRLRGTVEMRDEKRRTLVMLLQYLRAYIQKVADADTDQAASIIESAGIHIHKPTTHGKAVFHVSPGAVSGVLKLTAETPSELAFYEWQYSTDGGNTWDDVDSTLQAHTTVSGFTPGQRVSFRFRPVTRAGKKNWSQQVAVIVS
jgi:hypothetical protein